LILSRLFRHILYTVFEFASANNMQLSLNTVFLALLAATGLVEAGVAANVSDKRHLGQYCPRVTVLKTIKTKTIIYSTKTATKTSTRTVTATKTHTKQATVVVTPKPVTYVVPLARYGTRFPELTLIMNLLQ